MIERTERACFVRETGDGAVCAANHFEGLTGDWRPRPIDSHGRATAARSVTAMSDDFAWFTAPIANINSRLTFETTAGDGKLALMGTRGAVPTTQVLRINP